MTFSDENISPDRPEAGSAAISSDFSCLRSGSYSISAAADLSVNLPINVIIPAKTSIASVITRITRSEEFSFLLIKLLYSGRKNYRFANIRRTHPNQQSPLAGRLDASGC